MWEDRVHGLHYTANNTSSTTTAAAAAAAALLGGDTPTGFFFPGGDHHNSTSTVLPWPINPSAYALPHAPAPFNGEFYPERNYSVFGPSADQGADLSSLHIGTPDRLLHGKGLSSTMSLFGSLHAEFGKMNAKEIMDAKALAASKSHSEAERRRRQRINGHLAKLRSLLPNTTKTDKASLLAEVIEHVKELRRQTSAIAGESSSALVLPTEADELMVDAAGSDEEGRVVVRASLCCDDRSDLIPDLARALKSLKLRARRAEIATLGGRIKNVLIVTGHDDVCPNECVASIHEALRAVMDKKAASSDTSSSSSGIKRQRTNRSEEQQGSI